VRGAFALFVAATGSAVIVVACHDTPEPRPAPSAEAMLDARLDRAARTCASLASCAHSHDSPKERDPGACVEALVTRAPADAAAFEDCVARTHACSDVDVCVRARGDALATHYCRDHAGKHAGCEGSRLVTCSEDDPNESTSTDCASLPATCGELPQPGGLLAYGCVSSALCPAGASPSRCDGPGAVIACHDGAVEKTACVAPARCQELKSADGAIVALCEPPDHRHCTDVDKRWCDGGRLLSCRAHGPFGEVVVTDCALQGLSCAAAAEGGAECAVPGTPVCARGSPKCDGEALAFCAAGRRFRVSCRELGFASCDPDAHGVDAACAATQGAAAPPPPATPAERP
jgi:hypothetical protein